jgi:hypothetical protein
MFRAVPSWPFCTATTGFRQADRDRLFPTLTLLARAARFEFSVLHLMLARLTFCDDLRPYFLFDRDLEGISILL